MVVCFFPLLLFQFLSALPTTWRNLDQFWSLWVFSTSSQATYSHCTITISIFCSGKFFCFLLLACRLLDAPPPSCKLSLYSFTFTGCWWLLLCKSRNFDQRGIWWNLCPHEHNYAKTTCTKWLNHWKYCCPGDQNIIFCFLFLVKL